MSLCSFHPRAFWPVVCVSVWMTELQRWRPKVNSGVNREAWETVFTWKAFKLVCLVCVLLLSFSPDFVSLNVCGDIQVVGQRCCSEAAAGGNWLQGQRPCVYVCICLSKCVCVCLKCMTRTQAPKGLVYYCPKYTMLSLCHSSPGTS